MIGDLNQVGSTLSFLFSLRIELFICPCTSPLPPITSLYCYLCLLHTLLTLFLLLRRFLSFTVQMVSIISSNQGKEYYLTPHFIITSMRGRPKAIPIMALVALICLASMVEVCPRLEI